MMLWVVLSCGDEKCSKFVTQVEHATQRAGCAVEEGSADNAMLAALLHDIGHLLVNDRDDDWEVRADFHQEDISARFLAKWFDKQVTVLVQLPFPQSANCA